MAIIPPPDSYEGMDRDISFIEVVFVVVVIVILVLGNAFSDCIDKKLGRGKYAQKKEEIVTSPTALTWNERVEDEIRQNKLKFQVVQEEKKKLMLKQWDEFILDKERYSKLKKALR